MNKKLIILSGAMVVSLSAVAGNADNASIFKELDNDNDGAVTKQEAANNKKLMQDWKTIDKNADGKLELSEFSALESAENYVPVEEDNEPIGAAPTQ